MAPNSFLLLRGPSLALFAMVAACQSVAGTPAVAASARFQCGPTDDVELALVIPAPVSSDESHGVLHVTLGSEQWSTLRGGAKTLTVIMGDSIPAESARWCMSQSDCETPDRLEFAFERASLQPEGELVGSVEIHKGRTSVALPVDVRVEANPHRCG